MDNVSIYKKTFLIILIIVIAYLGISLRIDSEGLVRFDQVIIEFIQQFRSKALTMFMIVVTTIGSYKVEYPILFLAVIGIWILRRKLFFPVLLVINLLGVRLFNQLLKIIIERPRPAGDYLVEASGYSFPSGHAMVSIGFYGFISFLIYNEMKERTNKAKYIPWLFGILIFCIGLSRIYLGVHYPSDVIAGFLMGGLWLSFCIIVSVTIL